MQRTSLGKNEYTFFKGYQKEEKYRNAFNALSVKTFGLSFEDWYQAGFWQEKLKYRVYKLLVAVLMSYGKLEDAMANTSVKDNKLIDFSKNQENYKTVLEPERNWKEKVRNFFNR